MEIILKSPGLQHIIEKTLKCLGNKEDIASFRLINRDCNRIVDCPTFYLKKLLSKENILRLKFLKKHVGFEDWTQSMLENFAKCCRDTRKKHKLLTKENPETKVSMNNIITTALCVIFVILVSWKCQKMCFG